MFDYQVLRSRRKTLSLQVKHGQVVVRVPYHVNDAIIRTFIQQKKAWLKAKITEQNQKSDLCCTFTHGSTLFLFGQLVTLNIVFISRSEKSGVYLSDQGEDQPELVVAIPAPMQKNSSVDKNILSTTVKKRIESYLKQQAQAVIPLKVAYYAQLTQLTHTSIKIRQYRARWGSCNNRGELSFNYLLMMLPMYVIDYVVVHELCHLRHLNHSKDFWLLVEKYFPEYQQAKAWIKANQSALLWRTPQ